MLRLVLSVDEILESVAECLIVRCCLANVADLRLLVGSRVSSNRYVSSSKPYETVHKEGLTEDPILQDQLHRPLHFTWM
jgi:hypothetical protein